MSQSASEASPKMSGDKRPGMIGKHRSASDASPKMSGDNRPDVIGKHQSASEASPKMSGDNQPGVIGKHRSASEASPKMSGDNRPGVIGKHRSASEASPKGGGWRGPLSSSRLILLRFSALGDVAMTVPVVDSLARRYPQRQIVVVSRPFVAPLFAPLPPNVTFVGADLKGRHKGVHGLWRLARELRRGGRADVADLHDVLRSKLLRLYFRLMGCRTAHIDKGRRGRRRLVSGKERRQLPTSFERYARVLHRLGYDFRVDFERLSLPTTEAARRAYGDKPAGAWWVGIAPTAAHRGKVWPTERMLQAMRMVAARRPGTRFFVFGSRAEADALRCDWTEALPGVSFVADALRGFGEELQLMAALDVMVSMDSGNMHLASLVGTRVVSVWGQTHPYAGFLGYGQRRADVVEADLACRPCSIFGNRPCPLGPYPYPCLDAIAPEAVAERIVKG